MTQRKDHEKEQMLSGREWLQGFASKVTKHDCNTELRFYSKLIQPKTVERAGSQIKLYVHFNNTKYSHNLRRGGEIELYKNGMHRESISSTEANTAQTLLVIRGYI